MIYSVFGFYQGFHTTHLANDADINLISGNFITLCQINFRTFGRNIPYIPEIFIAYTGYECFDKDNLCQKCIKVFENFSLNL